MTTLVRGGARIRIVFYGGNWSLTSVTIAAATNSAATHVGVEFDVYEDTPVSTDVGDFIIPEGTWLLHATRDEYPSSVGPLSAGVVITPAADVSRTYSKVETVNFSVAPSDEVYKHLIRFIESHYGDEYGLVQLILPQTVVLGRQPDETPVCSTLVNQWLFAAGYLRNPNFANPAQLRARMERSGAFDFGANEGFALPVDLAFIGFAVILGMFAMTLLITWRSKRS